jgi:hypothetical protein
MRRLTLLTLALLSSSFLSGCDRSSGDDDEPPPVPKKQPAAPSVTGVSIPADLSPAERRAAEVAREALIRACGLTGRDWARFSKASLEVRSASGYRKADLDWDTAVLITLVYRDDLEAGMAGHHLLFHLGAGQRPGIVTAKRQAKELCGFVGKARAVNSGAPCASNSDDCILELSELKALDADRPPSVVETPQEPPTVHCFGYGFDPPQFWKCTPKPGACNKARAAEKREENDDYRVRTACKLTNEAHCFLADGKKTRCAPTAKTCIDSRREWSNHVTVGPCQPATPEHIQAAQAND